MRIVFDRNRLYVGVELLDAEPSSLFGDQMIRTGELSADDRFMFVLDPERNLSAFVSRRIGLTEDGAPQTIDYGTKTIGRAGSFELGFLQVRTAAENAVAGEDFTVFRPKRHFFNQSYVGMIYTRRATRQSDRPVRHTIGLDFEVAASEFRGSESLRFPRYYMKTPEEGRKGGAILAILSA